jgi:hypothetical protein
LLRADHARVEVVHGLAVRAFHARQVVQGSRKAQTIEKFIVFARQFQLGFFNFRNKSFITINYKLFIH